MSELTNRLREHAALHGDLGKFNDEQAQWERDLLDAADYIDNDEAGGVHTCHNHCQRLACMQRREIERLRGLLREWCASAVDIKSGEAVAKVEQSFVRHCRAVLGTAADQPTESVIPVWHCTYCRSVNDLSWTHCRDCARPRTPDKSSDD